MDEMNKDTVVVAEGEEVVETPAEEEKTSSDESQGE